MKFLDAVILCFLSAPGGVYFAWEEEGIVTVLSEIVAKVVFPRFELLEGEAVRWKLIWGSKLQVGHLVDGGAGFSRMKKALPPRWLTHLCMWNPVPGVAVAAAGRSPAWQLGPGVKEDEEKIQILYTGSLFSEQPCFRFIPSLRFLWKGLPLRDIKATTRVALIPRRGHPPVLIPRPVRVGWLQWPSGRHHPDKGERHR
jgi:hypothetical protein